MTTVAKMSTMPLMSTKARGKLMGADHTTDRLCKCYWWQWCGTSDDACPTLLTWPTLTHLLLMYYITYIKIYQLKFSRDIIAIALSRRAGLICQIRPEHHMSVPVLYIAFDGILRWANRISFNWLDLFQVFPNQESLTNVGDLNFLLMNLLKLICV